MADQTKIQWADATWNPMTGCTPVSEGCAHCYAERMARRFVRVTCSHCGGVGSDWAIPFHCRECGGTGETHFEPTFHPDRLDIPLHWRKPRRIFVCSMGDLFHEAFSDEQIDRVFSTIAMPQLAAHTFLILTKRPERMRDYMRSCQRGADDVGGLFPWPSVWLGVTCENQARADERIPILLDTPAAVRFISLEPMLGHVNLTMLCTGYGETIDALQSYEAHRSENGAWDNRPVNRPSLDWLILGGETGPGARPMQPQWALDVWRQCKAAGVPFFWKQWGTWADRRFPLPLGGPFAAVTATREYPEASDE